MSKILSAPQALATDAVEALKAENERLTLDLIEARSLLSAALVAPQKAAAVWEEAAKMVEDWFAPDDMYEIAAALRSRAIQSKGEA